jgi:hypothetical protein
MLMGVSAYAVENVKISGDAKVYYSTHDADGMGYDAVPTQDPSGALFDKDSSAADAAVNLKVSADLAEGISAGVSYTAISTLGLENNFVSNVWAASHTAVAPNGNGYANALGGAKVENASWFNEAWAAVTLGKSTAKVGRMELDTPLAYTETWSIERNSMEGAVLLNQDLPDTTLVAAWVGNGNGTEAFGDGGANHSNVMALGLAVAPVVNGDGTFGTYGVDGAYAFGIVNNSFKPLTVQAWYYDVTRMAQAYWLQADLNMEGILAGAQYSNVDVGDLAPTVDPSSVYALMLGYEMKDVATLKVAYSAVDEEHAAGFNTATASGDSKLYTKPFWNRSYVTAADAASLKVCANANLAGFDLGAAYTSVDNGTDDNMDLNEIDVTAGTSFGPLDAKLAYIYTDSDGQNDGSAYNTVQAYLTLNF